MRWGRKSMPAPDFAWLDLPETQKVIAALGAGKIRFVGGAVRDSLLDLPVQDIDIATTLHPADVMALAQGAGLKAVPTGIDHGTITVVAQHRPFEVTTLRRDVGTDGRRATVAFTDDWQADAARRDFTINALYMNADRQIFDYFGGQDDLAARRVRFIGNAEARICEDALRILRFFRFSARFSAVPFDVQGLHACAVRARDMMSLSRERIRDEMLKLLEVQNPLPALELMLLHKLFEIFLPEVISLAALSQLLLLEQHYNLADPLRRFAALLPANAGIASDIAARFKTSRQTRNRLVAAAAHLPIVDAAAMRAAVYRHGNVIAVDQLLLSAEPAADIAGLLEIGQHWRAPKLPLSGKHLIAVGINTGPAVSQALQALEADWIARDFPLDQPSLDALVKAVVARSRSHL
jgi:poly(A) polymerase